MSLTPVRIAGDRQHVGFALGKLARPLMSAYLDQSAAWRALRPWRSHPFLQALADRVERTFPMIWKEFGAMAQGLQMPLEDLLLWNCRKDLLHQRSVGSISVTLRTPDGARLLGHRLQGDEPFLAGRCHVVDVQLDDAPGYYAFYVPGTLPGHCFGVNRVGLVQTVDDIPTRVRSTGVPKTFLSRAVLDCVSMDDALRLFQDCPVASASHHLLAARDDERLFSIEATPGVCSSVPVEQCYGHANHVLHSATGAWAPDIEAESVARLHRVDRLLDGWEHTGNEAAALFSALTQERAAGPSTTPEVEAASRETPLATAVIELSPEGIFLRMRHGKHEAAQSVCLS